MPFTITEEMIRPNTDNNNSSWHSFVRNHYAREAGGSTNIAPVATDARMKWSSVYQGGWGGNPFQAIIELTGDLDATKAQIRNINPNPQSAYICNHSIYTMAIGMFNIYASARNGMIEQGLFTPRRVRSFPTWNVDYICSCGNSYHKANKWEAKFHGRCMFNMKRSTWDLFRNLIRENQIREAWNLIFELYDAQVWRNNLANPAHSRNGGPTGVARRSARRGRGSRGRRSTARATDSRLGREYRERQEEDDGILTTRELGRMLSNSNIQLPSELRSLLYELLLGLQAFRPLESGQDNPSPAELTAMIREHFNLEQLSA